MKKNNVKRSSAKKFADKNARLDNLYDEIEELEAIIKETEEKKILL